MSASHLWIGVSHFPADTQEQVLGDTADFIAPFSGSFNGACAAVEGGYEVDGTFGYASGAPCSTHLLGVAPVRGSDPPDVRLVLLPRSSYKLVDDWGGEHTLGLRASGSHSVAERAVRSGRLPWLLLAGAFVGLGSSPSSAPSRCSYPRCG